MKESQYAAVLCFYVQKFDVEIIYLDWVPYWTFHSFCRSPYKPHSPLSLALSDSPFIRTLKTPFSIKSACVFVYVGVFVCNMSLIWFLCFFYLFSCSSWFKWHLMPMLANLFMAAVRCRARCNVQLLAVSINQSICILHSFGCWMANNFNCAFVVRFRHQIPISQI